MAEMYKKLVWAVIFLLFGGAAYYFHTSGFVSLAAQQIENSDGRGNGVNAAAVFSGTYWCDENTGCKSPTKLILEEDSTLDIVGTSEDGNDYSLGQGSWGIGTNGSLIIKLQKPIDTTADAAYPTVLIANKISSLKITGFSTKKGLFPGMENPVFVRKSTN